MIQQMKVEMSVYQKNKDIVKLPSDVETESLTWETLNNPAKKLGKKIFNSIFKRRFGKNLGKILW